MAFKGTFRGNDVAVKKMKDVDPSQDSMEEFVEEIEILDKFPCDHRVHFDGACFTGNVMMVVTEYAPC